MRNQRLISVAILAVLLCAGFAGQALANEGSDLRIELTPTFGYRGTGDFDNDFVTDLGFDFDLEVEDSESLGLIFGIGLTRHWTLEFMYDHQSSTLVDRAFLFGFDEDLFDLDVTYVHGGVTYEWTPGQLRPFIGLSIGATRFSPAPTELPDETRVSTAIGGGLKVMFNDHVGLRLEGRVFSTFMEDGDDFYCDRDDYYDECRFDDDFFFQTQAKAGLVLAF